MKFDFQPRDLELLKNLDTPAKIQNFINSLQMNFEEHGDTCMSPKMVLKTRKAHCIESAMLAATALRLHGHPPLIVDLEAEKRDLDHVIAVFKKNGLWGAISKSNYAHLRYRDPIYRSIRELVMSYFHEYFCTETRTKTLRTFSNPLNLTMFDKRKWMSVEGDVWFIAEHLADLKHFKILNKSQIRHLKKVDDIEIKASKLFEWIVPKKSNQKW